MDILRKRLIIEGFGCAWFDRETVFSFLFELTKILKMRILVPPIIVEVPVPLADKAIATPDDSGISGYLIWVESGVQFHSWRKEKFASIDIFSCKDFSATDAISLFEDFFGPKEILIAEPENRDFIRF